MSLRDIHPLRPLIPVVSVVCVVVKKKATSFSIANRRLPLSMLSVLSLKKTQPASQLPTANFRCLCCMSLRDIHLLRPFFLLFLLSVLSLKKKQPASQSPTVLKNTPGTISSVSTTLTKRKTTAGAPHLQATPHSVSRTTSVTRCFFARTPCHTTHETHTATSH